MNEKSLRFKELLNAASASQGRKVDVLLELKDEISEARSRNFSFDRIADFLKQVDIQVSRDSVRRFCYEVLKEKPTRKHAKRKKSEDLKTQESVITHASITPDPSVSNAESKQRESQVSKPAPRTVDSGVAHAQQSEAISATRVGPRPGFRMAGDSF